MNCPHCNIESNAVVLETRKQDGAIIRKRACGHCGKNYFSREVPDLSIVLHRERLDKIAAHANVEPGPKVTNLEAFKAWR